LYAVEDYSMGEIADLLENEHAPRRSDRPWTRGGVREVLGNRRYTGVQIYGEQHKGKYSKVSVKGVTAAVSPHRREALKKKQGLRNLPRVKNDPGELVIKENAHPAIVSAELFEQARTKLARLAVKDGHHCRRTTPVQGGGKWVFSGLLYCGSCDQPMWGTTLKRGKANEYTYERYICSSARTQGARRSGCPYCLVRPEKVRDDVVKILQTELLNPQALARLQATLGNLSRKTQDEVIARRRALKEKAAVLDAQIATGSRRISLVPDELLAGLLEDLKAQKKQRQEVERELDALRTAEGEGATDAAQLAEALKMVENLGVVVHEMAARELRSALRPLIEKVTIHYAEGHYDRVEVMLSPAFCNLLGPVSRRRGSAGDGSSPRPARRP
jgi:hypothetical protein